MKFTLKEILEVWKKTYDKDMHFDHSKFIHNLIMEFDNTRIKKEENENE
tara:strand:- start:183 stop:329 length:147 start_codon:yes stop_codon:yes gene_type:complete